MANLPLACLMYCQKRDCWSDEKRLPTGSHLIPERFDANDEHRGGLLGLAGWCRGMIKRVLLSYCSVRIARVVIRLG